MLVLLTIPMKNTGKGQGRREEKETVRNRECKHKQGDDDKAYKSHHDLTAESLVQQVMCDTMPTEALLSADMSTFWQAWAQAVQVDSTIIIFHSGNHELVCVHH